MSNRPTSPGALPQWAVEPSFTLNRVAKGVYYVLFAGENDKLHLLGSVRKEGNGWVAQSVNNFDHTYHAPTRKQAITALYGADIKYYI